jgi:hypothetical protein
MKEKSFFDYLFPFDSGIILMFGCRSGCPRGRASAYDIINNARNPGDKEEKET